MKIYLYSINDSPFVQELSAMLAGMVDQAGLVRLAEDFAFNRTSEQIRSGDIIVLVLAGRAEIEHFLEMKEMLADFRLVILLADSSEEMATLAHGLMPRFLATVDQETAAIIHVIERMVRPSTH
ncbi:MAG: hypothetical protein F9K32_19520 [Desulfobulbaceae bacterium]|nr:MAG: hypothetical protein F9K32_19520 [Desulfobulbaceae bacterium]